MIYLMMVLTTILDNVNYKVPVAAYERHEDCLNDITRLKTIYPTTKYICEPIKLYRAGR